jgi:hypothetical protein
LKALVRVGRHRSSGSRFLFLSCGLRKRRRRKPSMAARPDASAAARRSRLLDRVARLRRRDRSPQASPPTEGPHERQIQRLEARVEGLEELIEGLQDALYRETVRLEERIEALERKSEPGEIARALSAEARKRGT